MPKDSRLYMTFPNDFATHPKIEPLSDAAFRAFVEMNGYSRQHRLDGVIPARAAERKWEVEALEELLSSHDDRPLVLRDGDTYVIREYGKHQQTTSESDALTAKRSDAGSRGAKKRWNNGSPIASASQSDAIDIAEIEIEKERTKDMLTADATSVVVNAVDEQFEIVWNAWPKKNDKRTAARRFAALSARSRDEIIPLMLNHAAAHRAHTPVQYVPYLATWLNQERWNDPLPESRSSSSVVARNADVFDKYR